MNCQGMDLYVAEITREQLARLEKACTFFGRFYWKNSLQNLWYLKEDKMQAHLGVSSFRQMKSGNHRYLGPVLPNKDGLDAFLEGVEVTVDEQPIDIDAARISTRFRPAPPLPELTDSNVVVFHGEYYQGVTTWEIQAQGPFNPKQLRLNFVDCGDNGYIFQSVSFKDKTALGREEAHKRGFLKLQFVVK